MGAAMSIKHWGPIREWARERAGREARSGRKKKEKRKTKSMDSKVQKKKKKKKDQKQSGQKCDARPHWAEALLPTAVSWVLFKDHC